MADIRVQVCYAKPDIQLLREVRVPEGTTLQRAVELSGILKDVPGIDPSAVCVGIHGKVKTLDARLRDRDRVEIYRPLIADPKESRRKRAAKREGK